MVDRFVLLLFATASLAACSQREEAQTHGGAPSHWDAGWHYLSNGGLPRIAYGFGAPPTMSFSGHCDARPIFALLGGTYSATASSASLVVDGKARRFDVYRGEHGGGLLFLAGLERGRGPSHSDAEEELSIAHDLANARRPLTISTDDGWTRQIPPSSDLGRFVQACIAFRQAETPSPPRHG